MHSDSKPVVDTLLRPLKELRLSVTDICTFRCPYCLPADHFPDHHPFLPPGRLLRLNQTLILVEALARLGVRKVKLTGGEPLLRPDLVDLVAAIRQMVPALELTLTTNGQHLAAKLPALRAAGLDRVTVSLDALDQATFTRMTGRGVRVETVLAAIEQASAMGFDPLKINTVVIRGWNDDQILPLAKRYRRPGFALRFIEFMDVGTLNRWKPDLVLTADEITARLSTLGELRALAPRQASETASRWAWAEGGGEVGLIASVTRPFCGNCSRARLTADGVLFTCLFSNRGTDLRQALLSGAGVEDIMGLVAATWRQRQDRYSELRSYSGDHGARKAVEMYRMGG